MRIRPVLLSVAAVLLALALHVAPARALSVRLLREQLQDPSAQASSPQALARMEAELRDVFGLLGRDPTDAVDENPAHHMVALQTRAQEDADDSDDDDNGTMASWGLDHEEEDADDDASDSDSDSDSGSDADGEYMGEYMGESTMDEQEYQGEYLGELLADAPDAATQQQLENEIAREYQGVLDELAQEEQGDEYMAGVADAHSQLFNKLEHAANATKAFSARLGALLDPLNNQLSALVENFKTKKTVLEQSAAVKQLLALQLKMSNFTTQRAQAAQQTYDDTVSQMLAMDPTNNGTNGTNSTALRSGLSPMIAARVRVQRNRIAASKAIKQSIIESSKGTAKLAERGKQAVTAAHAELVKVQASANKTRAEAEADIQTATQAGEQAAKKLKYAEQQVDFLRDHIARDEALANYKHGLVVRARDAVKEIEQVLQQIIQAKDAGGHGATQEEVTATQARLAAASKAVGTAEAMEREARDAVQKSTEQLGGKTQAMQRLQSLQRQAQAEAASARAELETLSEQLAAATKEAQRALTEAQDEFLHFAIQKLQMAAAVQQQQALVSALEEQATDDLLGLFRDEVLGHAPRTGDAPLGDDDVWQLPPPSALGANGTNATLDTPLGGADGDSAADDEAESALEQELRAKGYSDGAAAALVRLIRLEQTVDNVEQRARTGLQTAEYALADAHDAMDQALAAKRRLEKRARDLDVKPGQADGGADAETARQRAALDKEVGEAERIAEEARDGVAAAGRSVKAKHRVVVARGKQLHATRDLLRQIRSQAPAEVDADKLAEQVEQLQGQVRAEPDSDADSDSDSDGDEANEEEANEEANEEEEEEEEEEASSHSHSSHAEDPEQLADDAAEQGDENKAADGAN